MLVVDDDFMVARAHQRYVDTLPDFDVVGVAHTGTTALDAIRALRPHLVLLDIHLPDISGLQVIERTRRTAEGVDFLVLSAAGEAETVNAALRGGTVSYLLKPFRVEELGVRLSVYAHRRRLLDATPHLDQAALDRALGGAGRSPATAALPKGLSRETADLVAAWLDARDRPIGASDAAEELGISRVAVRNYLEHFVRQGRARVELEYGGAGRPRRLYSSSAPHRPSGT